MACNVYHGVYPAFTLEVETHETDQINLIVDLIINLIVCEMISSTGKQKNNSVAQNEFFFFLLFAL